MSHRHLSLRERLAIEQMLLFGLSQREISRRLGRYHGTIGREILRNQAKHAGSTYIGERGERLAKERRPQPQSSPRKMPRLQNTFRGLLKAPQWRSWKLNLQKSNVCPSLRLSGMVIGRFAGQPLHCRRYCDVYHCARS